MSHPSSPCSADRASPAQPRPRRARRRSSPAPSPPRGRATRGSGGGKAQVRRERPSLGDRMRMRVDSSAARRDYASPAAWSCAARASNLSKWGIRSASALSSEISGSSSIRNSGSTTGPAQRRAPLQAAGEVARATRPRCRRARHRSAAPALGWHVRSVTSSRLSRMLKPRHQARLLEHRAEARPPFRLPDHAARIGRIRRR